MRSLHRFLFAAAAALTAGWGFAATDANLATEAELDSIKGLGPAATARILQAREQGPFQDWSDFLRRVKGFKGSSAARLSDGGLTVNGQPFESVGKPRATP